MYTQNYKQIERSRKMASPMVMPFFMVNEAASSFGWMLLSAFRATQGGNAFEAQVSVSPYWEKAAWQYRPWAVCSVSDRHAIRFSLSAGLCRNRVGEGQ